MSDLKFLFDTYKSAVYEKDLESFLSIFDSELRVFDMWGRWSYDGIASWREMAAGWFGSLGNEQVKVEFNEIQTFVSEEIATASAFVTYTAVSAEGQRLRSLQNRLTWVARNTEGSWKIFHEHTSAPVNHETLKVTLERERKP